MKSQACERASRVRLCLIKKAFVQSFSVASPHIVAGVDFVVAPHTVFYVLCGK
jgi:hypothetical protein